MPLEIELKLLIDPADGPRLRRLPLLASLSPARPATRVLNNTYFDTPEHLLHQQGLVLRVRRAAGLSVQTLKADGQASAGLHQRAEWETPVTGPRPDLEALAAQLDAASPAARLLGLPDLAPTLMPVFRTVVRRSTWRLNLADGSAVELALDRGELICGPLREPISEVELELEAGDPAALFELARQLHQQLPLRVGNVSKSERGYALLTARPVEAVKSTPVELDASLSVEQGFDRIVRNCLQQMQANEPGVLQGEHPESIHQMRVGMRRLRSALRLFRKWIVLPAELQDGLAWLGGELGAARDADVLADETLARVLAASPGVTELQPLHHAATSQAGLARQRAAAAVACPRYAGLMLGFVAWLGSARWQAEADELSRRVLAAPLKPRANRLLRRRHEALLLLGRKLDSATPEEGHRIRIAAKKARYAAEFFQALLPAGRFKRYVRQLAALQDLLGWFNDTSVADQRLQALADHKPELALGAAYARGFLGAATAPDRRTLARLWKRLERLPPLSA